MNKKNLFLRVGVAAILAVLIGTSFFAAARFFAFREPMRLLFSAIYIEEPSDRSVPTNQPTLKQGLFVYDTAEKSVRQILLSDYSELSNPFLTKEKTILCTAERSKDSYPYLLEITENKVVQEMSLPASQTYTSPVAANGAVFIYTQGTICKCDFSTASTDVFIQGLSAEDASGATKRSRALFSDDTYLVYAKTEQNCRNWFACSVIDREEIFLSKGAECAGFSEPGKVWITENSKNAFDEKAKLAQINIQDISDRTRTHKRYLHPYSLNTDFWIGDYAEGYFNWTPVVFAKRLVHKKTGLKKALPEMLMAPDGKTLTVIEVIEMDARTTRS